jgi:hypothetical protein
MLVAQVCNIPLLTFIDTEASSMSCWHMLRDEVVQTYVRLECVDRLHKQQPIFLPVTPITLVVFPLYVPVDTVVQTPLLVGQLVSAAEDFATKANPTRAACKSPASRCPIVRNCDSRPSDAASKAWKCDGRRQKVCRVRPQCAGSAKQVQVQVRTGKHATLSTARQVPALTAWHKIQSIATADTCKWCNHSADPVSETQKA